MTPVAGNICAPRGFRAAAAAAGIKRPGSDRLDCALVVSDAPAVVAGLFTSNRVKAAPVRYCREVCIRGNARAIFANSGNANACTGEEGLRDTHTTAAVVARELQLDPAEVCVCSTGVIGVPLPMDRIAQGARECAGNLSANNGLHAARAIMTTDTVPKHTAVELSLSTGSVRIGAIAKGSGMIAPNLATMLCFITTDAALAPADLQAALQSAVRQSFNCMCVDNDMSTNDTVLCLANGQAGVPRLIPDSPEYTLFTEALASVCGTMARVLVRDGEGATKFVEIRVEGAANDADAHRAASAIARSQLCKTAFFGEDANWGRIACAAGYSGASFEPAHMALDIQGVRVMQDGRPVAYSEAEVSARMKELELRIVLHLGAGAARAVFWTSDLSLDYVRINAEYRS